MMNLEDRPLTYFSKGEKVVLVDDRGVSGYRKHEGFTVGKEFTVRSCYRKSVKQGRTHKILVTFEGYPEWVFSTRRFSRISYLPEDLFVI